MEQIFAVIGEPLGKGRPQFNRQSGRAYTPERTARYENLVRIEYERQCNAYKFPDIPLRMEIVAHFGLAKSDSNKLKARKLSRHERPTKKPDMDNIIKIVADSLNQVAYSDDKQIVECTIYKIYDTNAKLVVKITDDLKIKPKEEQK